MGGDHRTAHTDHPPEQRGLKPGHQPLYVVGGVLFIATTK